MGKEHGDGDSSADANTAAGLDVMQGKKPEQKESKRWFSLGSSAAKGKQERSKEEKEEKIADKALEMSAEMYKDPTRIQGETMGLGLRHIMYNVDPAFFDALVTAYVEEMAVRTTDAV